MIAVLAIEQLTGVVKGDQSGSGGSSNAMAANSTRNIQEILKDAQTIVEQEKANLTALNEGIKAGETKLATLDTEIAEHQAVAAALQTEIAELEKTAAPPPAGTSETDQEKATRLAAAEQLTTKNTELNAASTLISARQTERTTVAAAVLADKARVPAQQTIVDNAVQVQDSVQENLNASLRQSKAVAGGSVTLQAGTHQSTINPLTAKSLADTVQAIATSAINRPRTSYVCLDILKVAGGVSSDQRQQSPLTEQHLKLVDEKIINVCTEILSGG